MIKQACILFILLSVWSCNFSSRKSTSDNPEKPFTELLNLSQMVSADIDPSVSVENLKINEVKTLLKNMLKADQQYRDSLYNGNKKNEDFYWQKITETDKVNLALLDKIIQKFGWPTISTFGNEGAETAFLIIWHHRSKRNIMCKYFDLMEVAVKNKEMNQNSFKHIQERITQLSPDQIEY